MGWCMIGPSLGPGEGSVMHSLFADKKPAAPLRARLAFQETRHGQISVSGRGSSDSVKIGITCRGRSQCRSQQRESR